MLKTRELISTSDMDFLPAVLEVQERPASKMSRVILWIIVLFFIGLITWASLSQVDVVVTARGKIIPNGKVKTIQSLHSGFVSDIAVKEGEIVHKGQVLIELDKTILIKDLEQKKVELSYAQIMLNDENLFYEAVSSMKLYPKTEVPFSKSLVNRWEEFLSTVKSQEKEVQRLQAEQETLKHEIQKLSSLLPIMEERSVKMKGLLDKNSVSRFQYFDHETERIETEHNLKLEGSKVKTLAISIKERGRKINCLQISTEIFKLSKNTRTKDEY